MLTLLFRAALVLKFATGSIKLKCLASKEPILAWGTDV